MSLIDSARRLLAGIALVSATAIGLVAACKTPTQVTVDVSLVQTTSCDKTNGTAIIAAGDPAEAEQRVAAGFSSAATTSCDDRTKDIGTLVVTPGDSDRGAVVVLVSFSRDHGAADCKPPLYTDCVVARRSFAFVDHQKLTLPIDIDFDCVNVPCDSKSTCVKGQCFSSDIDLPPGGDTYQPPGIQSDGATEDAVVPDAGGGPTPVDDAGNPIPHCVGMARTLYCPDHVCPVDTHQACVANATSASCEPDTTPGARVCCTDVDCPTGFRCSDVSGGPSVCVMKGATGPTPPYCAKGSPSDLHCFGADGGDEACIGTAVQCCAASPTCQPTVAPCVDRMCCVGNDCPSGSCIPSSTPGVPGRCAPMMMPPSMPTCDGTGKTICGDAGACTGGTTCCARFGNPTYECLNGGDPSCVTPYCCGGAGSCGGYGSCPSASFIPAGQPPVICADAGGDGGDGGGGNAASCMGSILSCGGAGATCTQPKACCGPDPTNVTCVMGPSCGVETRFCCTVNDCEGGLCALGMGVMPGTCQ